MTEAFRIALAQLNPVLGDIDGNLARARAARAVAAKQGADLLALPELFICGYPPEDLVLKPAFQTDCRRAVESFAADTADGGPAALIGTPWAEDGRLYNTIVLVDGGEIRTLRHKHELPNYGVFDELRLFDQGPLPGPMTVRGLRLGAMVCEDLWVPDVTECLTETGADVLLALNGSPFENDKLDIRANIAAARVTESRLPLIYLNQVGGQDELVFDGASFALNADGSLAWAADAWVEQVATLDLARDAADGGWRVRPTTRALPPEGPEAIYAALTLGLRDYVDKNRFPGVVLGLSGGIDSALSAAIAVDALGADRVWCVMLPYRYTSEESLTDARDCAAALGVRYDVIPIGDGVEAVTGALSGLFAGRAADATEENLQSRLRGLTLMALSNKFGHMVLTTGNKSEVAVGYATLYGDMCGGFNAVKDVYKTEVFALSRWRNGAKPAGAKGPDGVVIPWNIIDKPPTAELRENQKDEDSLPPYDRLDDMLERLIERDMSLKDIIANGHSAEDVLKVQRLVYIAEYKRRQAAPGVKITSKNFGRDRRYPITNAWRDGV